jgi:hypothetical protein
MLLQTGACPPPSQNGNGDHEPEVQKIFDLWNERDLDNENFNLGQLISFFRVLKQIC